MKKNINNVLGASKPIAIMITLIFLIGAFFPIASSQNANTMNDTLKLSIDCTDEICYFITKNDLSFEGLSDSSVASWWDASWEYRKAITINHSMVDDDLTNFPVLVSFDSDIDLANNAQDDGDDIVFTDGDSIKLNHEIEYFNGSSGELVCWVNVTSLSSSVDTELYMYYGNSECEDQQNIKDVWDTDFLAVQHLNETSGMHYDSTNYSNDGVVFGDPDQNASGQIDGADYFDGDCDHIELPQVFTDEDCFTMEAWIYAEGSSVKYFVSQWSINGGDNHGAMIHIWTNNDLLMIIDGNSSAETSVSMNTWYHVVGTFNGTVACLYLNGVLADSGISNPPTWPSENTYISDRSNGNREFQGIIDEVRFSSVSRDAEWISTSYNNQNDPSMFYSVGPEESQNTDPIADFTFTPESPTTLDTIYFNDTSIDDDGIIVSWLWEFGDGFTSHLQNPTHQYNDNGTYTVSLTVTDNDDGVDEISKFVTVKNVKPIASFIYSPESPKVDELVHFTDTSIDPDGIIVGWTWDFGDETGGSSDKNPTHVYETAGTYQVSLTVEDNDGSENSTSKEIEVVGDSTPPTVKITKPVKALYLFDHYILPRIIRLPLIIGKLTIEADAKDDDSGIEKVEFYLNDILKGTDTTEPYTCTWTRDRIRLFHLYTVKVIAYSNSGETSTDSILVKKFL